MKHIPFVLLACACLPALAACTQVPCTLCYEDEWSKTPFPSQATQRIPPLEVPKDSQ
jgi:hypothetical protein